jgi:cytidylate kinase
LKKFKKFIIDITGSSGSGKTTAAKLVAKKYKFSIIFSGILFRYAAKILLEQKPKNQITFLKKKFLKLNYKKIQKMNLHTPRVSTYTSVIAKKLEIRKIIKLFQKNYVKKHKKVVIEGRDGHKIFPNADVKFYVVCLPLNIAAKRRWKQIKKKNKKISLKEVFKDLKKRDFMDRNRKHSKLERHPDSVYINTAKLNINNVRTKMTKIIDEAILEKYGN